MAGSDRVLIPDLETAYFEEHDGERILVLITSIYDAGTGEPAPCDPRRIASASALARTPPDLYQGNLERTAPRDLDEALAALAEDHDYLTASGVFSEEALAHWIRVKEEEATDVAARPHPREFELSYNL